MPKILTTVLSYNKGHYIDWQRTQEETFGSVECKDMDIIYYYGDHDKVELKDNKLYVDVPEGLFNIGHKTIKMFEYVLEHFEFDYLFRPNSSTFFIPDNVVQHIEKFAPKEQCYYGYKCLSRIGNIAKQGYLDVDAYNDSLRRRRYRRRALVHFTAGHGYILSRDVVEAIIDNKDKWAHFLIDDVALGDLITSCLNIEMTPMIQSHRINIVTSKEASDRIKDMRITGGVEELLYRCKTKNPQECIDIMNVLHSTFIVKE